MSLKLIQISHWRQDAETGSAKMLIPPPQTRTHRVIQSKTCLHIIPVPQNDVKLHISRYDLQTQGVCVCVSEFCGSVYLLVEKLARHFSVLLSGLSIIHPSNTFLLWESITACLQACPPVGVRFSFQGKRTTSTKTAYTQKPKKKIQKSWRREDMTWALCDLRINSVPTIRVCIVYSWRLH